MTIAEANEPLSNGLKIIIAQKGLKNLGVEINYLFGIEKGA